MFKKVAFTYYPVTDVARAEAFALGMSATDAAIAAGYPRGKSAKTCLLYTSDAADE